ncbi:MAG: hypothetical protein U0838_08345 [Chloroflexota bacterium]
MGGGFGHGHGWDARRDWIAEQHRRMHEDEARAKASGSTGTSSPTSDGPTAG